MAHMIETTAWTNEKPWHGIGTEVPQNVSTDEMMKAAQLDWQVNKQPLYYRTGKGKEEQVKGFFALERDTDHRVLDVVGPDYTPVQNHQAFEFFREFVEAGSATLETAGSLKGGRMVWVLANLNKSFYLAGKDLVNSYLLIAQPHQQGKAMTIQFTSVRVVCNNTLTMALRGGGQGIVRRVHRGQFDASAQEEAKVSLGIARDNAAQFADEASKMSKIKLDHLHQLRLLSEIFGDDELAREENPQLIQDEAGKALSYAIQSLTLSPGADLASAKNTAWGVLNAVTYTTDHLLRKSADSRMFNAWFGKSKLLKRKALDILTTL